MPQPIEIVFKIRPPMKFTKIGDETIGTRQWPCGEAKYLIYVSFPHKKCFVVMPFDDLELKTFSEVFKMIGERVAQLSAEEEERKCPELLNN